MIRKFKDRYSERERIIEGEKMAETGENTSIVREKGQKKRIIVIVTEALVCFLAIFVVVKVYTSPARQLQRQLDLGQSYLEEMDYEQAIVAFDQVIEIDPMKADAYLGKADAYVGMGDMETAIAVLEEGYELTQSDEILKRLEELRGSGGEAAYAETDGDTAKETTEAAVGESGLPYFELGFSPEDFTIAGYSVMDGDHLADVEAAAAEVMPSWKDVISRGDLFYYEGWYFNVDNVGIALCYHHSSEDGEELETFHVDYDVYSDDGIELGVSSFGWSMPPTEPFLYKGKVIPNVTSYEETLENLGIESLMQFVEEKVDGESFYFESQYGTGWCGKWIEPSERWSEYYYFIGCNDGERVWNITFSFHDDIVCMVQVRMH